MSLQNLFYIIIFLNEFTHYIIMCGIFALLNKGNISHDIIVEQFNKAQHRGPDNSHINTDNNNFFGFSNIFKNFFPIDRS